MAIRALITALSLAAGLVSPVAVEPAFAAAQIDLCISGHAPAGWKRPGGYCEIAADLNQHSGISSGPGAGGCVGRATAYGFGCFVHTFAGYDVYRVDNAQNSPNGKSYIYVGYHH